MTKIFIDPGHGGNDPGAIGYGLQEKNLTLAIALKIREMLLDCDGVQVKLSRETDNTLTLKQRTDMANAWGADYLMSIHINAGGGTGYEDFIYITGDAKSQAYQNVIHAEVIKEINDLKDRGKKRNNFHMLRESKMPAFLSENGFIDNAADAAKLKQEAYIERIARGHVIGLVKAFGLKVKAGSVWTNKPSTWAAESWKKATDKKIVDGSNPQGNVTREQIVVILDRAGLLD